MFQRKLIVMKTYRLKIEIDIDAKGIIELRNKFFNISMNQLWEKSEIESEIIHIK